MGTESEQIRDALVPLAIFALLTYHAGQRDRRLGITTAESYRAIAVFVITAAWDVILRYISEGELPVPIVKDWNWVQTLRPYFREVGTAWAAIVAGAVGTMGYGFIRLWTPDSWVVYFMWVFAVSAAVGLPMRIPLWFNALRESYYEPLGAFAYVTDGLSGLVVACTMVLAGTLLGFEFKKNVLRLQIN